MFMKELIIIAIKVICLVFLKSASFIFFYSRLKKDDYVSVIEYEFDITFYFIIFQKQTLNI